MVALAKNRVYSDAMTNHNSDTFDEDFQWGYSHDKFVTSRGELIPIAPDGHPSGWFDSRELAEEAQWNDLRWRIPTFLIRRPRPAQPEIIGRPIPRETLMRGL